MISTKVDRQKEGLEVAQCVKQVKLSDQQSRIAGGKPVTKNMAALALEKFAPPTERNSMKKFAFTYILATTLAFAQSGDISGSTSNFTTLGGSILKLLVALAGLGFVGLIIWGGLTLATNRGRGLAMVGGGLAGALLAGLAFVLVNTLTGTTVATGLLLFPLLP